MIYTVQGVCRYLRPRDIRALACTSRDVHRIIRALIDVKAARTFSVRTTYTNTIFSEDIWPKINVIIASSTFTTFEYRYFAMLSVAPTSYNYTGRIILFMTTDCSRIYHCMWARNGFVDSSICWWGYRCASMHVHRSATPLHFTIYIDQILRSEIMPLHLLQWDTHARIRVITSLGHMYGNRAEREDVIRSDAFAAILREL